MLRGCLPQLSIALNLNLNLNLNLKLRGCLPQLLLVCVCMYPSLSVNVRVSVCLSVSVSVCLSVSLSVSVSQSVCLSVYLSARLSICLSIITDIQGRVRFGACTGGFKYKSTHSIYINTTEQILYSGTCRPLGRARAAWRRRW